MKIHFNLYQIGLSSDDPVYTLKKVLEELNYAGLLACRSTKGRKGYNPIMMFAVLTHTRLWELALDSLVAKIEYVLHKRLEIRLFLLNKSF